MRRTCTTDGPLIGEAQLKSAVPATGFWKMGNGARVVFDGWDTLLRTAARRHRGKAESSVTVLDTIGPTRLIPLQHIVPAGSARVLLKLEYENPTGSMKDRMALAMVEAAEADGRLRQGGTVVEYTGGSTGVSLAFVCAAKRIPLHIVTSNAFSQEKRSHMSALGARLTLVASPTGGTTKALTLEMIETAQA